MEVQNVRIDIVGRAANGQPEIEGTIKAVAGEGAPGCARALVSVAGKLGEAFGHDPAELLASAAAAAAPAPAEAPAEAPEEEPAAAAEVSQPRTRRRRE